jgi:uncharacterized protein (TIGR02271 family)
MSEEADQVQTIPLVEEVLRVDKKTVETGRVVVRTQVEWREETAELLLNTEQLDVERVPVDRVVTQAPEIREEGDVLIVPILEEVMVVEKRLVLKEELRIRRTRSTRPERQIHRLRRETVAIERPDITQAPKES